MPTSHGNGTVRPDPSPRFRPARVLTNPSPIVGIGCRFPGRANDPEAFWKLLEAGVDAITEVPADRWDSRAFYDPDPVAGRARPTAAGAASSRGSTTSTRTSSASRRAKRRGWTRSSACCSRWPGKALEDAGLPPRSDLRQPDGRLRRDLQLRLLGPGDELPRPRRDRRLLEHRRLAEHRRQPDLVLLRPPRAERGRRHRLLVGAGGGPPGLPEHLAGRLPAGAGRRRQRAAPARLVRRLLPDGHAVAGRPLPGVRRAAPTASCAARGPAWSSSSRWRGRSPTATASMRSSAGPR